MIKFRQQLKTGSSVGLEISSVALRAVEVKIQARETVIQRVVRVETPPECVRDGKVIDPAALAEALRRLWEKGAFSTQRCGVAVPARVLTERMLTVPPAPPEEQRLIVRSELQRFAPLENDSGFGWMPMAAGGGPGGNTLAFLADEGVIDGYGEALSMAGLTAETYEPDAIAALRTLELSQPQEEAVAVVYLSETCSEMAFLEASRPRYFRRLDLGLEELTGVAAAERQPTQCDPEDPELARFLASQELTAPPCSYDGEELRPLAPEIKRSLQYYGRAYSSSPQPQQVLLLGDYTPLERLAQMLPEELNLKAEYLHPVRFYPHAPGMTDEYIAAAGDQFLVALGIALRPLAEHHTGSVLNLKSSDEAQTLARHAPRYLIGALTGSTALLAVSLAGSMLLDTRLKQAQSELKAAAAAVQAAVAERSAAETHAQMVQTEADRLRKQALPVPQFLASLGALVPEAVAMTTLDLREDGSLTLEGDALTPQRVNRLLQQLSDNPQFRTPDLDTLDTNGQHATTHFRVQTGLVGCGKAPKKQGA